MIAGDIPQLYDTAALLGSAGSALDDVTLQVANITGTTTDAGAWTGGAASAFAGIVGSLEQDLSRGGEAFSLAANALQQWAGQLDEQQRRWDVAEQNIKDLKQQIRIQKHAAAEAAAANHEASKAYDTALQATAASGALPPAPPQLVDVNAMDAALADLHQQLRAQHEIQHDAVETARVQGIAAGTAIDEAARMSPHYHHHHSGGFFGSVEHIAGDVLHFDEQFASGVYDFGKGLYNLSQMLDPMSFENLIHPGRWEKNMFNIARVLYRGSLINSILHPREAQQTDLMLLKGMIDYKDLQSGNFGHWAGMIAPQILLTIATAGGGGAADATVATSESVTSATATSATSAVVADSGLPALAAGDTPWVEELSRMPSGLDKAAQEQWVLDNLAPKYGDLPVWQNDLVHDVLWSDGVLRAPEAATPFQQFAASTHHWADYMDDCADTQRAMTAHLFGETPVGVSAQSDQAARSLLQNLSNAPADAPMLTKGTAYALTPEQVAAKFQPGTVFDRVPTSFTTDGTTARTYAARAAQQLSGDATPVTLRLQGGSQALNIQPVVGRTWGQAEWITGGRFEVTQVYRAGDSFVVDIKQVGTVQDLQNGTFIHDAVIGGPR